MPFTSAPPSLVPHFDVTVHIVLDDFGLSRSIRGNSSKHMSTRTNCCVPKAATRKRPDWSRPLPQPLQILDENDKPILTLKTLGDVRKMLSGLPEPFQLKTTWGHVAVMLDEAARGGDIMDGGAAAHGAGYGGR